MFTSRGNTGSPIDEIGESQFDDLAACGAALGKSTSDCVDPARLPGWANGLADAEGIPVGVAGAVLSTLSEKGDQECPGHDFLMSRSAVHYVSSKSEA